VNAVATSSTHGYGAQITRTPRDTEYDAFARVTRLLRNASADNDRLKIINAVDHNNRLWTILSSDLLSEGNKLPDSIRAGLLSLADFSLRHGRAVMFRKLSVEVLIDINMSVMKGLRGEVQA